MRAMPNNVAKVWRRLDKIWRSRIFGGGQVGRGQADLVKSVSKHNLRPKRYPSIVDGVQQRGQSLTLIGLLVVEIWRRRWSSPLNQRCCCSPTLRPTATKLLPPHCQGCPMVWPKFGVNRTSRGGVGFSAVVSLAVTKAVWSKSVSNTTHAQNATPPFLKSANNVVKV